MRFFLIDSNISLLLWSKELAVLIITCHQVANCLFDGSTFLLFWGENKRSLMPHTNQPLAILRHTIVNSVQYSIFYNVAQFSQLRNDQLQIPFMASKDISHILKHKHPWLYSLDCIDENREAVSGIVNAHLITKTTEWLTWRTTYNDIYLVCLLIFEAHF